MAIIRNLVVKISADISSLSKGLQRASKNLEKVSRSFTKIGTSLTTKITMPLIGLGTIIAKTSTEFEQSMANAASVAGASAEELERMKTIAREMGAKTVFSASQAADALYYMASAGYKVDQMADSIEATLNLASATQFDLAQTTDIVIASLNQFGLEASEATRVTNVFASAIGNSMATMDKISNSMGYVGPVAHSLGYEIEEVVGALSILYNAGYEGSTAGTTLRQVLVNLMNPTSAALEVFEDLGLSFEDLNPAAVDFATIVGRLGDAGITTSQAMKIFGARGGPGMLALISQGSDAINDMTTSITGTNKASEMAAIQLDTLSGQFKILKSELEEVAISFGDILIPIIRNFISQYISPLTKILMSLSNEQKMQAVRIAMIAAAIGPLFLAIGKVISILAVAIKILPIVFSKAGLIIAVIALLASSFIHLYKTNEEFREKVLGVWERVKSRLADITNKIKTWLTGAFQAIKENISGILIKIATNTIKAFNKIYEVAIFVWDYLGDIISTVIGIFGQAWDRHGEATVSAIVRGFTFIGSVIETIGSYIQHIAERIFPLLKKIVVDTFSGIKGAISKDGGAVISTLKNAFSFLYSILSKTANSIVKAYGRMFESLAPAWEKVKEMFKTLYETIKDIYRTLKPIFNLIGVAIIVLYSIFMGTMNAALSAISPLVQAVVAAVNVILNIIRALLALLRGDFSEAWEYLKRAVVGVWETIKQVGLAIYEYLRGLINGIVDFFVSFEDKIMEFLSSFWDSVVEWFNKFKDGIKDLALWIWSWIVDIFEKIKDFILQIINTIKDKFLGAINSIIDFFKNIYTEVSSSIKNIKEVVSGLVTYIEDYFKNLIKDAFNWGRNLIDNIADGIKSAWNNVVGAVESVGKVISDFLGFGSPTKKGPGQLADEWIPNLIDMMASDLSKGLPKIKTRVLTLASSLDFTNSRQSLVSEGVSPFSELLNGYLKVSGSDAKMNANSNTEIIMQIDGATFARLITPKLTKEYKRHGINLKEG